MNEIIILVTGGFDPIHSGHIAYLKDAKKLGNKLKILDIENMLPPGFTTTMMNLRLPKLMRLLI